MSAYADPAAAPAVRDAAEDEECVALYVGHLLGWVAEQPCGTVLMLSPGRPLPADGVGMRVLRQKYPDRITYARVVHRLKTLAGLAARPAGDPPIGTIHGSVHRTSCDFRVTVLPDDAGVTVECIGTAD